MWTRLAAAAAATLVFGMAGLARAENLDRAFLDTAAHTLTAEQAPRWSDVRARARLDTPARPARMSKACKAAPSAKGEKDVRSAKVRAACEGRDLRTVVNAARAGSVTEQLMAVDRAVNALPYVSDSRNWGVADYWETPQEMMARGGDCEGFALTKYFALRQLGVSDEAMRLAIVWDRRDLEEHAVLLVRADGDTWILDNKAARPVRLTEDPERYRLIYYVNESGVRLPSPVRTAERSTSSGARIVNGGRTLVLNVTPRHRRQTTPDPGVIAQTLPAGN